jgi:hypothetical protein
MARPGERILLTAFQLSMRDFFRQKLTKMDRKKWFLYKNVFFVLKNRLPPAGGGLALQPVLGHEEVLLGLGERFFSVSKKVNGWS